jgi:Peptidase A4 family
MRSRLLGGVATAAALVGMGALPSAAVGAGTARGARSLRLPPAHGQLIHPFSTNSSNNWFGYQQGLLEKNNTLFHSISGRWIVPRATQHRKGQAEHSSDWIGIGGGCDNAQCTITDNTLIQDGTEQDVNKKGNASYSAWWEIIPEPSTPIHMTVRPGDHMFSSIVETPRNSENWKITLRDVTRNETFTKKVSYTSSYATAEWIEETPLIIGTNAGFAALPNLTSPVFDHGTVNGHSAKLKSSERINLVNSNGKVIGAPSAPDPDLDGFNACAWAKTCKAPSHS